MERIVFAIDGGNVLHSRLAFLRFAEGLRAMGKADSIEPCIGYWEGTLECSYICTRRDWSKYFKAYAKEQECVLAVPSDTRQPCHLEKPDGQYIASVGRMVEIEGPEGYTAWTYNELSGKYFSTQVCQQGQHQRRLD